MQHHPGKRKRVTYPFTKAERIQKCVVTLSEGFHHPFQGFSSTSPSPYPQPVMYGPEGGFLDQRGRPGMSLKASKGGWKVSTTHSSQQTLQNAEMISKR